MSDAKDQHEPSMEEILASIRRIISEDGEAPAEGVPGAAPGAAAAGDGAAAADSAAAAAAQALAGSAAGGAGGDDDVLVLTEEVEETPREAAAVDAGDFDSSRTDARDSEALPEQRGDFDEPPPPPPPPLRPRDAEGRLISDTTAAASVAALSELVARGHREPDIDSVPMGQANKTLEEITRELLRPFLKAWLDENLPQIVERIVREEIGRLAIDAQRR